MHSMKRWFWAAVIVLVLVGSSGLIAPTPGEARGGIWTVNVFNGTTPGSSPLVWTGATNSVNFNWGTNAPTINGANTGAPADNFSVAFESAIYFTAGTYHFTVTVDDGVRVLLSGVPVIASWEALGQRSLAADYTIATTGNQTLRVEMFDSTGSAMIQFGWSMGGSTGGGAAGSAWSAEYFNNLDLSGSAVFTSSLGASGLSQNWGAGSPGGTVPVDNWSARFTRTLNVPGEVPEGMYLFYARADDNFRFTIDTTVIIDKWDSFAGSELFTAEVALLAGPHVLKFEYRDRDQSALAFLTWTPPNGQNPVVSPDGQGVPVSPVGGGATGTAPAATLTATVKIPSLNVRSAPSTAASILTRVAQGGVYTAAARSADNQWVQIWLDATTTGWVAVQYVTLNGDINSLAVGQGAQPAAAAAAPPPTGVRARTLANLYVRQQPLIRSPKVGLMPWGTEVDVVGRSFGNVWYQVVFNGTVGWAYSPYMRIISGVLTSLPFADGTTPVYEPPSPTTGVVVMAYGNMRIRTGPGLNYPQLNKIAWGTQVQVLARDATGYWYKIQYGPVVGWVYKAWFRAVLGDPLTVPVAAQ